MDRNKKYFLAFLNGNPEKNVLFEPFISKGLTEALIWRRGEHVWDTPDEYISTLVSCTERTRSDMFFLDPADFSQDIRASLTEALGRYRASGQAVGAGIICRTEEDVETFSGLADCICAYNGVRSEKVPCIMMDGTPEDALAGGYSGFFAAKDARGLLRKFGGRIRILGGLGVDFIVGSNPVSIYDAVDEICADHPGIWACGSGGMVPDANYLEFISLLGAFGRMRKKEISASSISK